jgi:hypothetical protein
MTIIAKVRLAPGQVGYFDELTRIHLTIASPEKTVHSGMNTKNLKKSVKSRRLILVSGTLDPETNIKSEVIVNEPVVEEVKIVNREAESIEEVQAEIKETIKEEIILKDIEEVIEEAVTEEVIAETIEEIIVEEVAEEVVIEATEEVKEEVVEEVAKKATPKKKTTKK